MMDNQYNYYRPDSDENRGAGNQQGFGAGPQKDPKDFKAEKRLHEKSSTCCRSSRIIWGSRRCDDAGNQLSDW